MAILSQLFDEPDRCQEWSGRLISTIQETDNAINNASKNSLTNRVTRNAAAYIVQ